MTVKKVKKNTAVEDLFNTQVEIEEIVVPTREYKFLKDRKFRFDFAWVHLKVAVEIQGGVFTYGGHSTGMGITRDCEKLALANIEGWTVFHFTSGQVRSGEAIAWLNQYFDMRSR